MRENLTFDDQLEENADNGLAVLLKFCKLATSALALAYQHRAGEDGGALGGVVDDHVHVHNLQSWMHMHVRIIRVLVLERRVDPVQHSVGERLVALGDLSELAERNSTCFFRGKKNREVCDLKGESCTIAERLRLSVGGLVALGGGGRLRVRVYARGRSRFVELKDRVGEASVIFLRLLGDDGRLLRGGSPARVGFLGRTFIVEKKTARL